MRTLVNELLADGEKRYLATALALNDRAAVCDGLIESRVKGQAYTGLNAVVLSRTERDKLAYLTGQFGRIMEKALARIVECDPAVLKQLGWPDNLVYGLKSEPPNRWLTAVGRFDFLLDRQGEWHLVEFNSDTPSGSQEVTQVEERLWRVLGKIPGVARLNPNIGTQMLEVLRDEALFAPIPPGYTEALGPYRLPVIGFLVRGRYLTDLAQVIYYAQGLKRIGLDTVVGDLNNLSLVNNRIYLLGRPVDAIYRLYPVEHLSKEPLFAAYMQGNLVGALKCINNLRGFLAQSKAILAWIWQERENSDLFDAEEQAVIARHLPETHLVSNLAENFNRDGYIIKEFYGREGAEVYDGSTLDDEGWQECRQWGTFVAQRRVEIAPQPHILVNSQGQLEQTEVYPCVGGFLFGGQWGGCYTRVGGFITTSKAQFIPTLVDKE